MTRRTKRLLLAVPALFAAALAGMGFLLYANRVTTRVTALDRAAIARFMAAGGVRLPPAGLPDIDRQIAFIGSVQAAVMKLVPGNTGIPQGQPREPADLWRTRSGLCYDRSRLLEKIFRSYGFTVRHAALYAAPAGSGILTVLSHPGLSSHAVTEVKTVKGWLLVDSNAPFLALDAKGFPVSLSQMSRDADRREIIYDKRYAAAMNPFYRKPFVIVYGLYSRHGGFYPPYNRIPDVNWKEAADNL